MYVCCCNSGHFLQLHISSMTTGIAPEYWGPHVWAAIHMICLGAPETFSGSDTSGYRAFFTNLPSILPCKKCQEHLRANLDELSIEGALSGGRETLFRWSVALHNKVNTQLGKRVIPYEEAKDFWVKVSKGQKHCLPNATKESQVLSNSKPESIKVSSVVLSLFFIVLGIVIGMFVTSKGRRKN